MTEILLTDSGIKDHTIQQIITTKASGINHYDNNKKVYIRNYLEMKKKLNIFECYQTKKLGVFNATFNSFVEKS